MFNLRGADESDLAAILAIYNHAIETTTAVFDYRPHTLQMRRDWLHSKRSANCPIVVAVNNAEVVGFATYGPFRAWPAYKYTVEHSVYVHRDHRGKGTGMALMKNLIATAREQQFHVMVGGIDADNRTSIAMHEKLGFVHAGTVRHAGYKFGRWLDLAFYQLLLETPLWAVED